MKEKVRKAVFPAAGMGTRFLPATKAQPKEMLPLVDKPLIQYSVEEAIDSGIDNIIIVTGRGKAAIEDHFDRNPELEHELEAWGRTEELRLVRKISDLIRITYTRQGEPLGLGHAVGVTKDLVGEEPFAVLLADDVIDAETPCLKQLLNIWDHLGATVIAVMEVPREQISAYGVVDGEGVEFKGSTGRLFRVNDVIEKPLPEKAPASNLAIIGRYVFPQEIFDCVDKLKPSRGSELQLTDAIRTLIKRGPVYAYRFEGKRYDAGDKLGFLKATVEFAMASEDLGAAFRAYLKTL